MARTEEPMNQNEACVVSRPGKGGRVAPAWLKLLVLSGLTSAACSWGAELSKDLQKVSPNSMVDVIVQFTTLPAEADIAAVAHAGGLLKKQFPNIRSALFTLPAAALHGIANNPHVVYISPDRQL